MSHTSKKIHLLENSEIAVIDYQGDHVFEEKKYRKISEILHYRDKETVSWIDVEGISRVSELEELSQHYHFHNLVLEDILNPYSRPRIEDYESNLFIILKMLNYDDKTKKIHSEQVSLLLGERYLITIQELDKQGDIFEPLRARLRNNKTKLRKLGPDYLLYSVLDVVVDNYFRILEKVGEQIEGLEKEVIHQPSASALNRIHQLKREMIMVRKAVWPLREILSRLEHDESGLIKEETLVYIRDVYSHAVQVIDTIESYRDILTGLLDIYLSSTSNRMNSVVKVLTVISTIFMPLTFIAGLYGMNFDYLPGSKLYYGFYEVIGVCFGISLMMIVYFRYKKWL